MNEDIYNNSPLPKIYQLYKYNNEKQQMELAVMDGVAVVNIYAGDWLYFHDQAKQVTMTFLLDWCNDCKAKINTTDKE